MSFALSDDARLDSSAYKTISLIGLDVIASPARPCRNTFIHHQAAANAPDVPSLTLSPDVLSVANARGEMKSFWDRGNVPELGK